MFVNKLSHVSRAHISESKRLFNIKSSTYYFLIKRKILADFQTCISVPLIVIFTSYFLLYSIVHYYTHFKKTVLDHGDRNR